MDLSINIIVFKHIIEYQYSESEALWEALQISHAYDINELINISNELYKFQHMNLSNNIIYTNYHKTLNKAKIIFKQYGYPLEMWLTFVNIK